MSDKNARRRKRPPPRNLQGLLDALTEETNGDAQTVTLHALLTTIGRRAYGPLLLFIGLFSISPATIVPGMTWLSAALTLVIAGQMALGLDHPWLPRRALEARFSRTALRTSVERARPWARRIDLLLKPRLHALARPPLVNFVALACVAAALITFPLGFIPFAPLAPGFAIVLFGLGMTAHDGFVLALGAALVAGAGYAAYQIAF